MRSSPSTSDLLRVSPRELEGLVHGAFESLADHLDSLQGSNELWRNTGDWLVSLSDVGKLEESLAARTRDFSPEFSD